MVKPVGKTWWENLVLNFFIYSSEVIANKIFINVINFCRRCIWDNFPPKNSKITDSVHKPCGAWCTLVALTRWLVESFYREILYAETLVFQIKWTILYRSGRQFKWIEQYLKQIICSYGKKNTKSLCPNYCCNIPTEWYRTAVF